MSKSPRVIFNPKRIADGDWQIEAHFPGAEIRFIKGLISREDAHEWLAGERKVVWLRSQGYAKGPSRFLIFGQAPFDFGTGLI